jgi:hypothetical protein
MCNLCAGAETGTMIASAAEPDTLGCRWLGVRFWPPSAFFLIVLEAESAPAANWGTEMAHMAVKNGWRL